MLRKSPGFTFIAIMTLALGIGANTAVFTVVNSILLRPLPYPESQRLASLRTSMPMFPDFRVDNSIANVNDILAQNDVFEGSAMFREWPMNLSGDGDPVRADVVRATPYIFALLGAIPERGRLFTEAEDVPGKDGVAVISDALWRSRYGADPKLIGRPVRLDGKPYTIIGVTSPAFRFENTEAWLPLALTPQEKADRFMNGGSVLLRLKRGVSLKQAQSELDAIAARLSKEYPNEDKGIKFVIHDLTAEGDRVAVQAESFGDHVSGKHYSNQYHFFVRLRDGLITEFKEYMDTELVTEILCGGQKRPAA